MELKIIKDESGTKIEGDEEILNIAYLIGRNLEGLENNENDEEISYVTHVLKNVFGEISSCFLKIIAKMWFSHNFLDTYLVKMGNDIKKGVNLYIDGQVKMLRELNGKYMNKENNEEGSEA